MPFMDMAVSKGVLRNMYIKSGTIHPVTGIRYNYLCYIAEVKSFPFQRFDTHQFLPQSGSSHQ